jgi:autotransporter-associated beta strand protein
MKWSARIDVIAFCLLWITSFCSGATVNLIGKVVDKDTLPVAGATVSLTITGISTTTDASGTFNFGGQTSIQSKYNAGTIYATSPIINNNNITFGLANETRVKITIFDLHGSVIQKVCDKTLSPGMYSSSVGTRKHCVGIVALEIGDKKYTFRNLPLNEATSNLSRMGDSRTDAALYKKADANTIDSLTVSKKNYSSTIVEISSYSGTVPQIMLFPDTATQNFTADPPEPVNPATAVADANAYVNNYKTNQSPTASTFNTESTNAALKLLSGFDALWTSGGSSNSTANPSGAATAYKNGVIKNGSVLTANITYVANITAARTSTQADAAYFDDRRGKSYSTITGFGPLASAFYTGSGITTTITSVPADAITYAYNEAGNDYGAITNTAALYDVIHLIQNVRANGASSNPPKYYFNYPRPWRLSNSSVLTEGSITTDTGYFQANRTTAESYPDYTSSVVVVPTLKPVRGILTVATPAVNPGAGDGGFPSGHTAESFNVGLLMAYTVPERFQELITRSSDLGQNRILAGMHSPLDVMGGRMLATAIAAAGLSDSANASVKAVAFSTAHTYLKAQTGSTDATFFAAAHTGDTSAFADWATNKSNYRDRLTYGFSQIAAAGQAAVVPLGAEVLLETRLPYLSATQRREVLRTTGISSGYPLLNDEEGWGRLNLFTAADGYGSFDGTIYVDMDSSKITTTHNGFYAKDVWKNNIGGVGRLVKKGSGILKLTGDNSYKGGTNIKGGTLEANSSTALGTSDVLVSAGGKLEVNTKALKIIGQFQVSDSGTVISDLGSGNNGNINVSGPAVISGTLNVVFTSQPSAGTTIDLITANRIDGKFSTINCTGSSTPVVSYTAKSVRLTF